MIWIFFTVFICTEAYLDKGLGINNDGGPMTASQLNCLSQQGFDLLSVNVFNTINETANIVGIQNYGLAAKGNFQD